MKLLPLFTLFLSITPAFAAEQCFQVTAVKGVWSRTPELLCVDGSAGNNNYAITLKSGLPFDQQTIATFHLNLLQRARCIDCNQDVFGLENPSNSSFNLLSIKFDGTRDTATMKEAGRVSVGETTFFYRSL